MLYANDNNGDKITANPGLKGFCPFCNAEVISKCGMINIWHWAHVSLTECDYWKESETEWHLDWKKLFPPENIEVKIILKIGFNSIIHRADVRNSNGVVIEFQNSHISPHDIELREDFYKKMLWVINSESFFQRFAIYDSGNNNFQKFKWFNIHKSWLYAKMPVFIDLGKNKWERRDPENGNLIDEEPEEQLFLIKKLYSSGYGWGKYISFDSFIKKYSK